MAIQPDALISHLQLDLEGLLLDHFDVASPWYDSKRVAASILFRDVLKKNVDRRTGACSREALSTFLSVNERCRRSLLKVESWKDEVLLGNLREVLNGFFWETGEDTILDVKVDDIPLALGPGSNYGSVGSCLYDKLFDGPIAATRRELIDVFDNVVAKSPWIDAEIRRTYLHGNPQVVKGSRLSYVPKNDKTDRTINVEPAVNMLFQLGFGRLIERRLESFFGISLSSQQEFNRRLALKGSRYDSYATIDLKSASDSLALGVMEQILPLRVYKTLCMVRSPSIKVGSDWIDLHMIGTMGNGFTFPLQTALFASVVRAAAMTRGWRLYDPVPPGVGSDGRTGNWGVFGDDIIVERELVPMVTRLLDILGFQVNKDKSFVEGPFRESCGIDCYVGTDVRCVYVRSLRTVQDRFIAINLLAKWSAKNAIPLRQTIAYLLRFVPKWYVPPFESDDAGIKVPSSELPKLMQPRTHLHKGSYIFGCAYDAAVRRRRVKELNTSDPSVSPEGAWQSFLYGELSGVGSRTISSRLWGSNPLEEEGSCETTPEPLDLGIYQIPLREEEKDAKAKRFRRKRKVAINWDYFPTIRIIRTIGVLSRSLDPLDRGARKVWNDLVPSYLAMR